MKANVNYILAYTTKGKLHGIFTGYTEAGKSTGLQADYVYRIVHGENNVNQCKGYTFYGAHRVPTNIRIEAIGRKIRIFFEADNKSVAEFIKKVKI